MATPRPLRCAILVVSDRAAAGIDEDTSRPAIVGLLTRLLDADVAAQATIPSDRQEIAAQLRDWVDEEDFDLILTIGGIGFAPCDLTPEATSDVVDRAAPGLAEAMRAAARAITPYSTLTRGIAGIRGQTLIVNLPSGPKGATENLNVILQVLPRAIALLRGESSDPALYDYRPRTVV
ncbi:MAG: MogA/MoaB family molybdenum cofactor biosynthesis protein [Anaerolineae bacterium]